MKSKNKFSGVRQLTDEELRAPLTPQEQAQFEADEAREDADAEMTDEDMKELGWTPLTWALHKRQMATEAAAEGPRGRH